MRESIEYWSVVIVRGIATRLPDAMVRGWGTVLGLMFYALDRAHRRVTLTNLEQCFPNRSARERRTIARATFAHFGQVLLKLLTFSALPPDKMIALAEYEGDERVRLAYAKGKGVLFFTGHFGFWECQAMAHAVALRPIGVLARSLDNARLNDLLERIRTSTGNHVIYRHGAVRRVLKTLAAGEGVALLIDQHMHSADAIWVNFFRRPAATTSTLAALALRTGAAVIPVFAEPLPGGRYKFIYESPVEPPKGDGPDAIREFTQRCTDVLEMHVRKKPELWLWMHRRWRDAPTPDTPGMFPKAKNDEKDRDLRPAIGDQGA
ncbi:MAG: Lipid biosynthesis lauroyl acyltransferase [Acidobacteriota bacterium]|jgi:KDO2-lipid IV(A) lauroyltransferase